MERSARTQGARDFVLGRMVDEGYISREQYQAATAEPLAVKPRVLASSDSYAMEAIRQQVIAQVGLERAISQGLRIYTTIDARLQKPPRTPCVTNSTRSSGVRLFRTTRPTRSTPRCSATRKTRGGSSVGHGDGPRRTCTIPWPRRNICRARC